MATLKTYLNESGISLRNFGEKVGMSPSYLCELAGDKKTPSIKAARRIEKCTAGKVTVSDWPESSA